MFSVFLVAFDRELHKPDDTEEMKSRVHSNGRDLTKNDKKKKALLRFRVGQSQSVCRSVVQSVIVSLYHSIVHSIVLSFN